MKPSIPKGTRDFSPVEMLRRKYIFSAIEKVFQKYGFLPLETPAMENLETLTGKYGEEGDRLIFKILKRGADLERAVQDGSKSLAGEALRYDLTVPFARYVVQNQNELAFPFKRYQIQPVWRADRPQKGRYREFYQCDADMIGSRSLLNEVELTCLILEVFNSLGLRIELRLNSRKVLSGLMTLFGAQERAGELIGIMDKLDKQSLDDVIQMVSSAEFSSETVNSFSEFLRSLETTTSGEEREQKLRDMFAANQIEEGLQGLRDLTFIADSCLKLLPQENAFGSMVKKSWTLARGLDYYTGAIFEVKSLEGTMPGSICGGGRYDDLTGVFGLKGMSGVGISFGADRIYDVLLETNKFPAELGASTKLLFANFGEAEAMHCLKLLRQVREAGIAAELYPDPISAAKLQKQFTYAEKKGIPFMAMVGESEMKEGKMTFKQMGKGEKGDKGESLTIEEMIQRLKS